VLARLAVVPMVLEARGLDVTPATVARFEAAGDAALGRHPEPHLPRRNPPRRGRHEAGSKRLLRITRFGRRSGVATLVGTHFRGALSLRSTLQRATKPVCPGISTKGLPRKDV
jgi:hypothetical protein